MTIPTRTTPGRNPGSKAKPLPRAQQTFIHAYLANGHNGVRAYLAAYPACHSRQAAAQHAYQLLRRPAIRAQVDALDDAAWKKLQMSGEEVLGRVALDARADPRELYDEKGNLLAVHLWPDSIARCVKAIKPGPFGTAITLNDSLTARRILLEQTGKLKNPIAGAVGDLARLLAGDFTEDE